MNIDTDAERVVRKLTRNGYKAYLVGGCVRDLLLRRIPKDFDVATSATPHEIRELFRNCRIIGRRFRLAHIFFGSKIIETSTFRANPKPDSQGRDGLLIRKDNVFGSETEDAQRRDFTINGLFYDVSSKRVIDHVGGLSDLKAGLIRTIGEPDIRFQEDPVRILRAIKFAARLEFEIEENTYAAIVKHRGDISKCASARVLEEFYRFLRSGAAHRSMTLLTETGVDEVLADTLAGMFRDTTPRPYAAGDDTVPDEEEAAWLATWAADVNDPAGPYLDVDFATSESLTACQEVAWNVLKQLDIVAKAGHEGSNSFLLAAILSPFLTPSMTRPRVRPGEANAMIMELAQPLLSALQVTKRDSERMRQTLLAQRRLAMGRKRRSSTHREYFQDALLVFDMTAVASGTPADETVYLKRFLERSRNLQRDENGRRRRRRGGRRRRQFLDELHPDTSLELGESNPDEPNGPFAQP